MPFLDLSRPTDPSSQPRVGGGGEDEGAKPGCVGELTQGPTAGRGWHKGSGPAPHLLASLPLPSLWAIFSA